MPPLWMVASVASAGGVLAQKTIAMLVMPAGLVWLVLLAAASAALYGSSRRPTRDRKRVALVACAAMFFFWLVTTGPAAYGVAAWLERGYENNPPLVKPLDAAILLGGAATRTPAGRAELTASGDRLAAAAALANRGDAARIVCSVGFREDDPRSVRDETLRLLQGMGVPAHKLMLMHGSRNTREEVAAAAELSRRHGWRRVGIVTSAWHMRRTLAIAERHRLDVVPIAADHRGYAPVPVDLLDVVPSAIPMWTLQLAAWEILGAAVGR